MAGGGRAYEELLDLLRELRARNALAGGHARLDEVHVDRARNGIRRRLLQRHLPGRDMMLHSTQPIGVLLLLLHALLITMIDKPA